MTVRRRALITLLFVGALGGWLIHQQLPAVGAGGLLHPMRRGVTAAPPATCEETTFAGAGAMLKGWRCHGSTPRRGTLIYLHGVADNRTSAAGVIRRFGGRGFDVWAYDSRAHGESEGDVCTYGYFEKGDLWRVLDTVNEGPVLLIGTSLGAAVALQSAAHPKVTSIVAVESFSDLRTVAIERAPFFFTTGVIAEAFQLAETRGRFRVDDVSPIVAARSITIPVLIVHGDSDRETPPAHSQRLIEALGGPKRLILVPGAGHNHSLRAEVWTEIEAWVESVVSGQWSVVSGQWSVISDQ
jgi:pimeloyl-ACP methyl ester carboxylesterase